MEEQMATPFLRHQKQYIGAFTEKERPSVRAKLEKYTKMVNEEKEAELQQQAKMNEALNKLNSLNL